MNARQTLLTVLALSTSILAVNTSARADKSLARQHYDRGLQQYNLGEYPAALEEFLSAYKEYSDPNLLFNLAQCHRQMGNTQKAVTLYRSFIRETDGRSPNADEVRKLITKLESESQNQTQRSPITTNDKGAGPPDAAVTTPPVRSDVAKPVPATVDSTVSKPVSVHPSAIKAPKPRTWIWAVVGGSVVAVGLGVGIGLGLGLRGSPPNADFGTVTVK